MSESGCAGFSLPSIIPKLIYSLILLYISFIFTLLASNVDFDSNVKERKIILIVKEKVIR